MDAAIYVSLTSDLCCGEAAPSESIASAMPGRLNEEQFAAAVRESLPALTRVAKRLAGDPELADEALQNALLRAAKSWRTFRGEADISTWMTRIVIHAVRDAIAAKTKRRQPTSLSSPNALDPIDVDHRGPLRQALTEELRDQISIAMMQLPHRQREVFALVSWHAMNSREVSELLSISEHNVHANLHAARLRLRQLLAHYLQVHDPPSDDHQQRDDELPGNIQDNDSQDLEQ